MKIDTKKLYKFTYKAFGWVFDQFPLGLKFAIVFGASFAVFWYGGYIALLKTFAIVAWILVLIMAVVMITDKVKRGAGGPFLKLITKTINRGLLRDVEELSEQMEEQKEQEKKNG